MNEGRSVMDIGHEADKRRPVIPDIAFCEESQRLLNVFAEAVTTLVQLHEQQFSAIIGGESDFHRFDLLIHMVAEKKQQAKYAYIHHLETHGCQ